MKGDPFQDTRTLYDPSDVRRHFQDARFCRPMNGEIFTNCFPVKQPVSSRGSRRADWLGFNPGRRSGTCPLAMHSSAWILDGGIDNLV
jgi:hypothetical protein